MSLDALQVVSETSIPVYEILIRFTLASLFGMAIGLEREIRNRAAGMRTHMLVSLAAAAFTVITFELFREVIEHGQAGNADPIRVIEAVTAGVAFLAAGSIIQSRGTVRGLTTGAGMWLAGAVGVACGGGFYVVAVLTVVLAVIILALLGKLEHMWARRREREGAAADGDR